MMVSSVWWTAPIASCVSRPAETLVSRRPETRLLSSAIPLAGATLLASSTIAARCGAFGCAVSSRSERRWTTRSCRVRSIPVSAERVAAAASSRAAMPEICCSSDVEGVRPGAGATGLVDLLGEVAQHVLDRAQVDLRDL